MDLLISQYQRLFSEGKYEIIMKYSSEIRCLQFIKCSIVYDFIFSPNECPVLCQHRPGHSLGAQKYIPKVKYVMKI